jgi:hypothetical protein
MPEGDPLAVFYTNGLPAAFDSLAGEVDDPIFADSAVRVQTRLAPPVVPEGRVRKFDQG